ncbi:MAG: class I SAM-dependent methyltransferase [Acidobacteria bacterium]|nr:class I SAM-dependent methyltransferase [Acidobacteriota bacterium]
MSTSPPACPICGAADSRRWLENSDFLFHTTSAVHTLNRCLTCRCAFLHPMPEPRAFADAYPRPYWWIARERPRDLSLKLETVYRETVLRHHVHVARRHLAGPAPKVLDVGCGSGTFLHVLRRVTGIVGEGLDVSPDAAQAAQATYGLRVHAGDIDTADLPEQSYDLITLFHVLEHLPRPGDALARVGRWLAPGGTLLLQVPNLDSWQCHWFGRRWSGLDIPRHVVSFRPRALADLLRRTGYEPGPPRFFSLRDNAAAIATSLAPALDPVAMAVRGDNRLALTRKVLYFSLLAAAQPLAVLEAMAGRGGTFFLPARRILNPRSHL